MVYFYRISQKPHIFVTTYMGLAQLTTRLQMQLSSETALYSRLECATWLPETREPEKKPVKAGTGRDRFEILRLQVSRTRTKEV